MLDHDLHRTAPCPSPRGPDELLALARAAHPGPPVVALRLPLDAARPAIVRFTDNEVAYLDACAGRVLGVETRYGGLFGRLEQLHKLTYWTQAGWDKIIPGQATHTLITGSVAALFATLLIVVGVALWWPGRGGSWRRALTLDRRLSGRALMFKLHSTVAFWISAVAIASALTGLTYAFDWPRTAVAAITGSVQPEAKQVSAVPADGGKRLPLDAAWTQARLAMPELASADIFPPRQPRDAVRIRGIERGAPHPHAFSTLFLDAYDGHRLAFRPYASLDTAAKAIGWAHALHTGEVGGPVAQILLTLGALGTLVSIYAGFSSYIRKLAFRRGERAAAVPSRDGITATS